VLKTINREKKWQQQLQLITEGGNKEQTIPNKNTIASAATMDNPAPDSDASVKSLGIFLQDEKIIKYSLLGIGTI
jgi:hypothetical protein